MQLDVRTILVLWHPHDANQILLLRRNSNKKLFPNLITGIGGKVELEQGEGKNLEQSMWREFQEETKIPKELVINVNLRLSTIVNRGEQIVLLLWYTGKLLSMPEDLNSTEGTLEFFDINNLPLKEMIPTSSVAIPFIINLPKTDTTIYSGSFTGDSLTLTTSNKVV